MSTDMLEKTIGQLVTENPGRSRVFETFGLDYCCGGKQSLADACADKGLDAKIVAGMLALMDEKAPDAERDWSKATMSELCDNIEQTHHTFLKRELPRMEVLVRKVADVHGGNHPYLFEVRDTFLTMKVELEAHTVEEESRYFPMFRDLDVADKLPASVGDSLDSPIQKLVSEHEDAGEALEKMRALTSGYKLPGDACNSFRMMYDSLKELERNMHRHVHKENSILFPRAASVEKQLRAQTV